MHLKLCHLADIQFFLWTLVYYQLNIALGLLLPNE